MSSRISVPALSALTVLTPLAPAAVSPDPASVVTGVVAAALVAAVVALRRRRWMTWTGAALLTLLATAAALPLTGLGGPSEEEIRRHLTIQSALGRPVDLDAAAYGGALRFLPWDANDLLFLTAAFLATALLLLALDRAAHPRDLLPLRWRWPAALWTTALALVTIPQVMVAASPETTEHGMMIFDGNCFAGLDEVMSATAVLMLLPQPAVVAAGAALWATLSATGHRVAARTAGRLTLVPLLARDLMMTWIPVLGCAQPSSGPADALTPGWVLFTLLPIVLIALAVRLRRAKPGDPVPSPNVETPVG